MARFVLCHRFGGIYLDADTLLLRDFEELFNYPGAFAYRWSRMVRALFAGFHQDANKKQREYNSAVLKLKCVQHTRKLDLI
jgi:alpha-N-acetylglucosamine transferase